MYLASVSMSRVCITPDDSAGNHDRSETERSNKHRAWFPKAYRKSESKRESGHFSLHLFSLRLPHDVHSFRSVYKSVYCLQYDFIMIVWYADLICFIVNRLLFIQVLRSVSVIISNAELSSLNWAAGCTSNVSDLNFVDQNLRNVSCFLPEVN